MRTLIALVAGVLLVSGCTAGPTSSAGGAAATGRPPADAPELEVTVVADGLQHPWDVVEAPDGTVLFDERGGGLTAVPVGERPHEVEADFGDLFARGET